jgi:hypothetical protein
VSWTSPQALLPQIGNDAFIDELSRDVSDPLYAFALDAATLHRGLDPGRTLAAAKILIDPKAPLPSAEMLAAVRECIGDDSVIAAIGGSIADKGVTDGNNPALTVRVPDYSNLLSSFPDQGFNQLVRVARMSNFSNAWSKEETVYLWGDHHDEERIQEFWNVFLQRFAMGDSIPHALSVALEDSKYFKQANFTFNMNRWMTVLPNEQSGELYDETGAGLDPVPDLRWTDALKSCILKEVFSKYAELFPAHAGDLTEANREVETVSVAVVTPSGGNDNKLLIAGLAAFAAAVLVRRKKS